MANGISRRTPIGELPELLRVEEAAAWLDTSKGLVYEMARRGDLPCVRLGRLLRIRRDELLKQLAAMTSHASEAGAQR